MLSRVNLKVDSHQASLLALHDIKVKIVRCHESLDWHVVDALYSITWVEQIKVLLALLGEHCRHSSVLLDVVLHRITNQRLSGELNSYKLAHTLMHQVMFTVRLVDETLS